MKYILWWTTPDGQSSMYSGEYESEIEAWNAIPAVTDEFSDQGLWVGGDGSWSVEAVESET